MGARRFRRGGATLLLAVAAACRPPEIPLDPPLRPAVRIQVVEHFYPVVGRTTDAVLESLQRSGPPVARGRTFGVTAWRAVWGWQSAVRGEVCEIVEAHVDIGVDIWLPDWQDADRASRSLVADWDLFLGALHRHEMRHRDLARKAGAEIAKALLALNTPTCEETEATARARAQAVATEYQRRDRELDRITQQGRTDGVVWPVGGLP